LVLSFVVLHGLETRLRQQPHERHPKAPRPWLREPIPRLGAPGWRCRRAALERRRNEARLFSGSQFQHFLLLNPDFSPELLAILVRDREWRFSFGDMVLPFDDTVGRVPDLVATTL
jgi:hypothetical protein